MSVHPKRLPHLTERQYRQKRIFKIDDGRTKKKKRLRFQMIVIYRRVTVRLPRLPSISLHARLPSPLRPQHCHSA